MDVEIREILPLLNFRKNVSSLPWHVTCAKLFDGTSFTSRELVQKRCDLQQKTSDATESEAESENSEPDFEEGTS